MHFALTFIIHKELNKYSLLVAGFATTAVASILVYLLQRYQWPRLYMGKLFGNTFLNAEMQPLMDEEKKEDKEHLKHLDPHSIMDCFRVGIDLNTILDDQNMYSKWWKIWSRRHPFRVFVDTPYHKFIAHCIFYTFFVVIFLIHISSMKADFSGKRPTFLGWLVFTFWLSLFFVEAKEIYRSHIYKHKAYLSYGWNVYDIILFIYFWILLFIRFGFYVQCNEVLDESKNHMKIQNSKNHMMVQNSTNFTEKEIEGCYERSLGLVHVYAFYFILWVVRVFQFFAVSRFLGPKVIMLRMMLGDLLRIIIFIVLVSCSFGLWMEIDFSSTQPNLTENKLLNLIKRAKNNVCNYYFLLISV